MKRLLLLVLLFAVCLSGCGGKSLETSKVKFTYWTVSDIYANFFEQQTEKWNQLNPDSQIELNIKVLYSDQIDYILQTTLNSGVSSPDLGIPDFVDIQYSNMPGYITQFNCLLHPLNIITDNHTYCYQNEALFDAYTHRDICFGIPYGGDYMVMYYNKALLDNAGIESENINTWKDFLSAGEILYEKTGTPLLAIDIDNYDVFITILSQTGFRYNSGMVMGTSRYLRVLYFLEELIDNKCGIIMPGGRVDSNSFKKSFQNEEIGAVMGRLSDAGKFAENFPELEGKLFVSSLPSWEGNGRGVFTPGYATAIIAHCEESMLLKEFLTFAKLEETSSLKMLQDFGGGLLFDLESQTVRERLDNSKYASFYANDLHELFISISSTSYMIPNMSVVSEIIEKYRDDLITRVLKDY